jgi:hypothetical protein
VLTVMMAVPDPLAIEVGTKAHVGAGVTTGVMPLQDKFTVPLKPLSGAMATVEVADPPAATEAGARADAVIV